LGIFAPTAVKRSGFFREGDHLLQLFFGLIDPGYVVERNASFGFHLEACPRLAKVDGLPRATHSPTCPAQE
jgi:hypothetical protein